MSQLKELKIYLGENGIERRVGEGPQGEGRWRNRFVV